jgi:chaperonin cofactor prefoldin
MDEEFLFHDYDAAKRREYYLKNRKLKGRKHGSPQIATHPKKTRAQLSQEHQKRLEAQVGQLKARLEKLKAALELLVKQAKARSGVKDTTSKAKAAERKAKATPTTAAQKKADSKPRHLTAAQKLAEEKAQAKYRSKNEQLSVEVKSLTDKIKTIQERIAKMKKSGSLGARDTKH